jgi:hypothetical protein
MVTLDQIHHFLTSGKIAFAGVSRDRKKFGGAVFCELFEKGYNLYPVHPHVSEIHGVSTYPDILSLPGEIKSLFIVTPPSVTEKLVKEAIARKMEMIWIQKGCETKEIVELAAKEGITVISGKCIMMFAEPTGIHKFHRTLVKLFGKYPK